MVPPVTSLSAAFEGAADHVSGEAPASPAASVASVAAGVEPMSESTRFVLHTATGETFRFECNRSRGRGCFYFVLFVRRNSHSRCMTYSAAEMYVWVDAIEQRAERCRRMLSEKKQAEQQARAAAWAQRLAGN